ncbi:hypothetical protein B0A55_10389 [Friedmanniomyces simplex]|uniref:Uncharacterized protein n=1 Tax=Friedmanniomyces simplex TaxID=329884 RepID=A0A4V5NFQ9_9PEZI|nr:hypothetical protein B0A55_10389 [Friedmanniomyces simplex]
MSDEVVTDSHNAAGTHIAPEVRLTRQFTLYARCCSRLWLTLTILISVHRSSLSSPSSSKSFPTEEEEAEEEEDSKMEADEEELCYRCLDRLACAVWRLPSTNLVLSGDCALSRRQRRERRGLEGNLMDVLGLEEQRVGGRVVRRLVRGSEGQRVEEAMEKEMGQASQGPEKARRRVRGGAERSIF